MKELPCNQPTYFDVDDTLIMWNPTQEQLDSYGVDFNFFYRNGTNASGRILPHRKHIDQLKKHAMRGHTIIVWSAGGSEWAYAACVALGLEDYVHLALEKPCWAYDDKKPQEFFETKWMEDT